MITLTNLTQENDGGDFYIDGYFDHPDFVGPRVRFQYSQETDELVYDDIDLAEALGIDPPTRSDYDDQGEYQELYDEWREEVAEASQDFFVDVVEAIGEMLKYFPIPEFVD